METLLTIDNTLDKVKDCENVSIKTNTGQSFKVRYQHIINNKAIEELLINYRGLRIPYQAIKSILPAD